VRFTNNKLINVVRVFRSTCMFLKLYYNPVEDFNLFKLYTHNCNFYIIYVSPLNKKKIIIILYLLWSKRGRLFSWYQLVWYLFTVVDGLTGRSRCSVAVLHARGAPEVHHYGHGVAFWWAIVRRTRDVWKFCSILVVGAVYDRLNRHVSEEDKKRERPGTKSSWSPAFFISIHITI
jgi:hypothetical protein